MPSEELMLQSLIPPPPQSATTSIYGTIRIAHLYAHQHTSALALAHHGHADTTPDIMRSFTLTPCTYPGDFAMSNPMHLSGRLRHV